MVSSLDFDSVVRSRLDNEKKSERFVVNMQHASMDMRVKLLSTTPSLVSKYSVIMDDMTRSLLEVTSLN